MVLFLFIAYLALMSSKKAEQNKVWVGLSKETAHQLGTPISSLMAWLEVLPTQGTDPEIVSDMGKDVQRLSVIAERFSKIGSQPEREPADVAEVINAAVEYMRHRISGRVQINVHTPDSKMEAQPLCRPRLWSGSLRTCAKTPSMQWTGKGASISASPTTTHVTTSTSKIPAKALPQSIQDHLSPRLHHQTAGLGTGPDSGKTHCRRISRRAHLCKRIRNRQRHHLPYRDETHHINNLQNSLQDARKYHKKSKGKSFFTRILHKNNYFLYLCRVLIAENCGKE